MSRSCLVMFGRLRVTFGFDCRNKSSSSLGAWKLLISATFWPIFDGIWVCFHQAQTVLPLFYMPPRPSCYMLKLPRVPWMQGNIHIAWLELKALIGVAPTYLCIFLLRTEIPQILKFSTSVHFGFQQNRKENIQLLCPLCLECHPI